MGSDSDAEIYVYPHRRANPRAFSRLSDLQAWLLGSMVSASSL